MGVGRSVGSSVAPQPLITWRLHWGSVLPGLLQAWHLERAWISFIFLKVLLIFKATEGHVNVSCVLAKILCSMLSVSAVMKGAG